MKAYQGKYNTQTHPHSLEQAPSSLLSGIVFHVCLYLIVHLCHNSKSTSMIQDESTLLTSDNAVLVQPDPETNDKLLSLLLLVLPLVPPLFYSPNLNS